MSLPHRPIACRVEAWELFTEQVPQISTNAGLLRAAIALSMHELPDVNPAEVERRLYRFSGRILGRVRGNYRRALVAHLHEELFERFGFRGNEEDYYNARNSYLPVVLETGLGIPISLSLVYSLLARRLGVRADGVNAPGHFLVQVTDSAGSGITSPMLVDPFHAGRLMTREDALQRIEQTTGNVATQHENLLRPATHQQWIARMLGNLMQIFRHEGRERDFQAMQELGQVLARAG